MNPARKVYRWGAAVLALFSLVPGYYALTLRWAPSADFDVTGILFLMQNLPRLTAIVLAVVFVATAVTFWVRSFRAE